MTSHNTEYCVIGDPIKHSLSPEIHHFVFQSLGLNLTYVKRKVQSEELAEFIEECRNNGRPGFNITIPHKETVLPLLDEIDPWAKRTGAVNTVINSGGNLKGFNTDITGCMTALKRSGWSGGKRALILGSGGASRSAVMALVKMEVKRIMLYDIFPERSDGIIKDLSVSIESSVQLEGIQQNQLSDAIGNADLLINATPVGMWPNTDQSPIPESSKISVGTMVFDMVYNPLSTKLLIQAEEAGARIATGIDMLIGQALAADEIWLDRSLSPSLHEDILNRVRKQFEAS